MSEQDRLTAEDRWYELHHDLRRFVEQRAEHSGNHLVLPPDDLLASATRAPDKAMTSPACASRADPPDT